MKAFLRWLFAAVVFGGIGGFLTFTYLGLHPEQLTAHKEAESHAKEAAHESEEEHGKEGAATATTAPASHAAEGQTGQAEKGKEGEKELPDVRTMPNGDVAVKMDAETQQRVGLIVQPLQHTQRPPEVLAYGVLQEDPAGAFALRAPIAGFLKADQSTWPQLGQKLVSGTTVGTLAPRLTPVERADLASRLAASQGEVDEAQAALDAARAGWDRLRKLSQQQLASDRQLQEAEAAVKTGEAKVATAKRTVEILRSSVTASTGPAGEIPLAIQKAGYVVQAPVQPGEAVESGQSLLQVSNQDRLLARIEVPVGQLVDSQVKTARIAVAGHENEPLVAQMVGPLPSSDMRLGGQTFLFRVDRKNLALQAGMVVSAFLDLPGEPKTGVIVPRSALIRYGGRSWVYVLAQEEEFLRRPLVVDHPEPSGIFVTSGLEPGSSVVVQGAQSLLSKELTFSATEEEE